MSVMNFNELMSSNKIIAKVPYGSHVYGTADYNSDHDYIIVVEDGVKHDDQYIRSDGDYSVFSASHFQQLLDEQYISVIEAYFTTPVEGSLSRFVYSLNKSKLRESISQRASNSYVKCKKKLTVEDGQQRIGTKSLFHSLRMLTFGIQLAENGKITDFSAANHYLERINEIGYDWDALKTEFQPIYNSLSSKFREVAPK